MEIIAQNGISAHWSYKTKTQSVQINRSKKWIESFTKLNEVSVDSHEFVESIKTVGYDKCMFLLQLGKL